MTLLDRLKERIDTDLTDPELQANLDSASQLIEQRFGVDGEVRTERLELPSYSNTIVLKYTPDPDQSITISENDEDPLTSDDYEVSGRIIKRLNDSGHNYYWGRYVTVEYTRLSQSKQRDEAAIQLAILQINFDGTKSSQLGDSQETKADYRQEEARILRDLQTGKGMGVAS